MGPAGAIPDAFEAMNIPSSVIQKAIALSLQSSIPWSAVFITFDRDFNEWFCGPFRENGDDNLYSVAEAKRWQLILLKP
jgi:hypothetical protein